jgi:DNA polymerase-3 subunit beta
MIEGSITVKPQVFAAAVKWAAGFLAGKPAIPVHGGLKLDAESGTLTITAFSEYVSAVASVPFEGDGSGVAVVSGRLLKELAGTFGTKDVGISGDKELVAIASGRWNGTLPTMSEDDYPAVPPVPSPIGTVNGDEFARAVAEVVTATSKDPDKQVQFRAVHLTFGDGRASIMGTDSYRAAGSAAEFTSTSVQDSGTLEALVLGEIMEDVAAGFMGPDAITVGMSGTQIAMSSRTRSVVLNTLAMSEGGREYPVDMVRRFLAAEQPEHAIVAVGELVVPLKRAALMREKEGPVTVRFSEGLITIVSRSGESRRAGTDEVDVKYSGPETSLDFNPRYFAEALSSAPGDEVDIALTAERHPNGAPKPVVLTVAGAPWRHVMQPLKEMK